MVILDGTCYRLRGDGSVTVPEPEERTPYAVVTNFVPSIRREPPGRRSRAEVSALIDGLLPLLQLHVRLADHRTVLVGERTHGGKQSSPTGPWWRPPTARRWCASRT